MRKIGRTSCKIDRKMSDVRPLSDTLALSGGHVECVKLLFDENVDTSTVSQSIIVLFGMFFCVSFK